MEQKAANILLGDLGPGDGFIIKWCGIKLRLRIRPITAKQLIKISREISKIRDFEDGSETMFQALMVHASDARHICKAIAISTGTPFVTVVTRAILGLPHIHIQTLFKIVQKQADPSVFFYTIASAKSLSVMKKRKEEE